MDLLWNPRRRRKNILVFSPFFSVLLLLGKKKETTKIFPWANWWISSTEDWSIKGEVTEGFLYPNLE